MDCKLRYPGFDKTKLKKDGTPYANGAKEKAYVFCANTDCLSRECFYPMYDRGSFVCGRGYTSYYENPPLVCGRRHLHGCPDINKAWATDSGGWPEDWVYDWGELLNRLMTEREIEKEQDLIGETYFEGYVSPFPLHNLVPIESIVEAMNEKAWDISGEYAGDWPDLTSEDKKKLKNVIVRFLKKRRVKEFSSIENIVEKTITADDIREGTE